MRWVKTYQKVRQAIVENKYPPGARLVERQLSEALGVSRSSLRTALHHLAAEGLVELKPGEGATVANLAPADVLQVLDVRAALEGMAARLATQHVSEAQISELEKTIDGMREALERRQYLDYLKIAQEFHSILVEAADNDYLAKALEAARVRMVQYGTDILLTGHIDELFRGHELILKAVKAKKVDQAEQHARDHVYLVKELICILHPEVRQDVQSTADGEVE